VSGDETCCITGWSVARRGRLPARHRFTVLVCAVSLQRQATGAPRSGDLEPNGPSARDFVEQCWKRSNGRKGAATVKGSEQEEARTRVFSRVIGPFLVIICVTAVARASDIQALFSQFEANSLWTWVIGASALALGLTMVTVHQYWRGAAAVVVSLLGWLVVLRGLLLLAFPSAFIAMANNMIGAHALWIAVAIGFALVGLYLTYFGWFQARSRE
jgi:hypothetical protein